MANKLTITKGPGQLEELYRRDENELTNKFKLPVSIHPMSSETISYPPKDGTYKYDSYLADVLEYDNNDYKIYHKYKPYTDNTNLLRFGHKQPYVWRYIDEAGKSAIPPIPAGLKSLESRTFPIRSGTDDLARVSLFLTSGRGIQFLSTQFLLQMQQPFDETQVYNPLEVPLAVTNNLSFGLIKRPQRHTDISGGVLGALASLVGISISNGNTAPPSSVGQDALSPFNKNSGKGLLRAQTAIKAMSRFTKTFGWSDVFSDSQTKGILRSFFRPAFPLRQTGVFKVDYRQDEVAYNVMLSSKTGVLDYLSKEGYQIATNNKEKGADQTDLRSENVKHITGNNKYAFSGKILKSAYYSIHHEKYKQIARQSNAITPNPVLSAVPVRFYYTQVDRYLARIAKSENESMIPVVDDSLGVIKNLRMARVGAGDALNQIGVLRKGSGNADGVPISESQRLKNHPNWTTWKPYEDDLIAFFFYDIVNERYIPFRATVKGINESTTATWEDLKFIGRADQIYNYNGFVRNLSFQFSVVITSVADLLPTWQKINYMKTSLKPAGYTSKGSAPYNRFMIPPMFALTIGDMYKYQPIVMTAFNIIIPENANWETQNENNSGKNGFSYLNGEIFVSSQKPVNIAQLPKEAEIQITCNLLEKESAVVGGVDFGHLLTNPNPLYSDPINRPFLPSPTQFDWKMHVPYIPREASNNLTDREMGDPTGLGDPIENMVLEAGDSG